MRSRRALGALLAVPVLALSACGDGESDAENGGSRPAPTTVATEVEAVAAPLPADEQAASRVGRFRASALTACANVGAGRTVGRPPEGTEVIAWARRSVSTAQARARALDGVEPPRSEAPAVSALTRDYEAYLDLLRGVASIEADDEDRAESGANVVAASASDLQAAASRLGIAACGPLA